MFRTNLINQPDDHLSKCFLCRVFAANNVGVETRADHPATLHQRSDDLIWLISRGIRKPQRVGVSN